jgi:hypothetical protein
VTPSSAAPYVHHMIHPRPLFIVGNKRSGSTLLVNMLNEHPMVCVTHESDIIWALFQAKDSFPEEFRCFEYDAPRGLNALMRAYGEEIRNRLRAFPPSNGDLRATFFEIQRKVIEAGTEMHLPLKSAQGVQWIGDKKPVQHAFPAIRSFIDDVFPDAHYVHIVRRPEAVVASQLAAASTWPVVPEFWKEKPDDLLDHWCTIEEWALELKAVHLSRVHTVRLEDLSVHPRKEMSDLFEFLDVNSSDELLERLSKFVYADVNSKYSEMRLPASSRANRLMKLYRYE